MNRLPALLCALAALILMGLSPQPEVYGRVVGVTDGDTVRVLTPAHELLKVRLTEIDAPEHDQPFGQKSKQMLSGMVFQHQVRLVTAGEDRYGRTLARIYAGPVDVNARMVQQGGAWAFRRYLTDQRILVMEGQARAAHRGLWAMQADQIESPWEWRKNSRSGKRSDR